MKKVKGLISRTISLISQFQDIFKDKTIPGHPGLPRQVATRSLFITIEKWKRAFDKNMKVGAIFMDLSKVFDTLNHRFLLTKLRAYSLQPITLKQMENYLTGHFQGIKSVIVIVHGLK